MTVTAETYCSVSDFGTARRCGQALSAAILQRMTQAEAAAAWTKPETIIIGDQGPLPKAVYITPKTASPIKSSIYSTLKLRYDAPRIDHPRMHFT